ncbi:MAG: CpsD/CapB family tyrosine-protein kinase [Pseudomonadota bacterium]
MTENARLPVEHPVVAQRVIASRLADAGAEKSARLGALMQRQGAINARQVKKVLREQQKNGGRFGEIAMRLGFASAADVEIALAVQNGRLHGDEPLSVPEGLVVIRAPQSDDAEEIRTLRSRLLTTEEKDALRLFAVAPTSYSVGADYLSLNLAASFAQLRKRVLLIDADLRRPRIGRLIGAAPSVTGLSDVVVGQSSFEAAVRETCVVDLSVMTAGRQRYSPQDLIASDAIERILDDARAAFDHVIILTTPGKTAADGRYIWARAGAVLPVVRKNISRRRELKALSTSLKQSRARILGAAMTV